MAHALTLGASGILGWAVLNQSQIYPTPTTFPKITGTTNRPLTFEQTFLLKDPRISLVSGIDFTKSVNEVVEPLKKKVPSLEAVSHVFFTAFLQKDDPIETELANTELLKTATTAIERVSSNLESVILQTGGKGYGLELSDKVSNKTPPTEDAPRIPPRYADHAFYYSQYDFLKEFSAGKSWTFTEIRPDGIISFAPEPILKKDIIRPHSDTSQDILAEMQIFAAFNPKVCSNGEAFNFADRKTVTWEEVWPALCSVFGLLGAGSKQASKGIEDFVKDNLSKWAGVIVRNHLRSGLMEAQNWPFVNFMLVTFDFDRQYDFSKARNVGFQEEVKTVEATG
ncbi:hypothetical protein BDZ45DRAFT_713603 [Acephala macrosclerotiorum]|nr:hypothetical protein BDZ45DRAFT_713603 [Acephala macrosclerotiorum]